MAATDEELARDLMRLLDKHADDFSGGYVSRDLPLNGVIVDGTYNLIAVVREFREMLAAGRA